MPVLPALETLVVDLHQAILMLDSEDELAIDACHLGKILIIRPVSPTKRRGIPETAPG